MIREAGLDSFVAHVEAMAERQHMLLTGIVAQFIEFTKAMEPVLAACSDAAVLRKAHADIDRVNAVVLAMAKEGGLTL